jgi:hypothetical protein
MLVVIIGLAFLRNGFLLPLYGNESPFHLSYLHILYGILSTVQRSMSCSGNDQFLLAINTHDRFLFLAF